MFAEDLSAFFSNDEMADNATIGSNTVVGIFENQFFEVHGIEGLRPTFTCDESEVSSIDHGDALTIKSTSYEVVGIHPDGTGVTTLILEQQ